MMMREIKFRGKRKDNGDWVYGNLITPTLSNSDYVFGCYIYETNKTNLFANSGDELYQMVLHKVDPATVGQYTGLNDENGKEICEGDVLGREAHWIFYVGFKDGCFVMIPCEQVQRNNWTWRPARHYVVEDWEVIGNIHDNPELRGEG